MLNVYKEDKKLINFWFNVNDIYFKEYIYNIRVIYLLNKINEVIVNIVYKDIFFIWCCWISLG